MSQAPSFEAPQRKKPETEPESEGAEIIQLFPENLDQAVKDEIFTIVALDQKIADLEIELEIVCEALKTGKPRRLSMLEPMGPVDKAYEWIIIKLLDKFSKDKKLTEEEFARLADGQALIVQELVGLRKDLEQRVLYLPVGEGETRRLLDALDGIRNQLRGNTPPAPERALTSGENGLEFRELIDRERQALTAFFGPEFFAREIKEVPPLPPEITPEKYEEWKEKGFELHYIPPVEMKEDAEFPGWKQKPGKKFTPGTQYGIDFFDAIKNGDLPADAATLAGAWMLVDTRRKPRFDNGNQSYDRDLLAPVLADLRQKGLIANFQNTGSRFNISPDELEKPEVRAALAATLGIPVENFHLPRAVDANYLGNAFYPEWGETDCLEWHEDVYQIRLRLFGGHPDGGGLSYVNWHDAGHRFGSIGFRPQGRFSLKR
ncbi:MAG: hypothetical protein AAB692_02260 [Patescibacteria group bacterium]